MREEPYFNRDVFTFCSHQHTPNSHRYGGPGMVESELGIYIAWDVFEDYAAKGSLAHKETVLYALGKLLGDSRTLLTNLPAQGVTTLQKQSRDTGGERPGEGVQPKGAQDPGGERPERASGARPGVSVQGDGGAETRASVLHEGGGRIADGGAWPDGVQSRYVHHLLYAAPVKRGSVEVIEDIVPLYDIEVTLRLPESPRRVYLAPQLAELPFTASGGEVSYRVPKLECHQMVVIEV
jgi:hypothetical protein